MEKTFVLLTAFIPCLIFYGIIHRQLRHCNPALTFRLSTWYFGLGVLCVVPVSIWGMSISIWAKGSVLFYDRYLLYHLFNVVMLEALPEELARWLILRWRLPHLPLPVNLTTYLLLGSLVGLGFGTIEHLGFCYIDGWHACWERIITSVPYHTMAGAILGYFVGTSILTKRISTGLIGLAITVPLHAFNNFNLRTVLENHANDVAAVPPMESTRNLIEEILISHWPSNLFVTFTVTILALMLYRKSKSLISSNSSEPLKVLT